MYPLSLIEDIMSKFSTTLLEISSIHTNISIYSNTHDPICQVPSDYKTDDINILGVRAIPTYIVYRFCDIYVAPCGSILIA